MKQTVRFHNVRLMKGKEVVYDENLPFRCELSYMDEDITGFIRMIQPSLVFDTIQHTYIRDLTDNER